MVTNVTSLLKTVKTVEDEAVRGTRALESTIEAISQEVKVSHIHTCEREAAAQTECVSFEYFDSYRGLKDTSKGLLIKMQWKMHAVDLPGLLKKNY